MIACLDVKKAFEIAFTLAKSGANVRLGKRNGLWHVAIK